MASLIAHADLVIGGSGSSNWERCALGVPALVAVLSADQAPIAQALDRLGVRKQGVILRAALVLFGKKFLPDFPQCALRLARFRGVTKDEFIDQKDVRGPAFNLLETNPARESFISYALLRVRASRPFQRAPIILCSIRLLQAHCRSPSTSLRRSTAATTSNALVRITQAAMR